MMEKICANLNVLSESSNIVRIPFLVKGKLIVPPDVHKDDIERAFSAKGKDADYVRMENAQVAREQIIDRKTMKYTDEFIYEVMPLFNPAELIESDIEKLSKELYSLPFNEVEKYLSSLAKVIQENSELVDRVRNMTRKIAEHPDAYHDAAFASFPFLLDPAMARSMVDNELGAWGKKGSEFLDSWVPLQAQVFPGLSALLGSGVFNNELGDHFHTFETMLRAMPTRQLHITAGNSPAVPLISMVRAMMTKSAAVIKSPYGAHVPAALIALAAVSAAPDHPITKNLSVVYWPGGDLSVENLFFLPESFDRIIVWGAPDAVASVRSRVMFTKTICFNPRYGFSFIGKEAFNGKLREAAARASMDTMIWNQKACIASYVHYVEGTFEQAEQYAELLKEALAKWDDIAPNFITPDSNKTLVKMRRGKYMDAFWHLNKKNGDFSSGVVVIRDSFDMMDHPFCRLVPVRPVNDLRDALKYLHSGVATVGIYPEERRLELRDAVLARGVTNAMPLGQSDKMFGGMAHDGMMVLNELVDWKNG
ncbi:MAG TPA: acyl-CoA reductase [Smithella sp.]|nr:acyl-CoA reductase [Smithella sp.]